MGKSPLALRRALGLSSGRRLKTSGSHIPLVVSLSNHERPTWVLNSLPPWPATLTP